MRTSFALVAIAASLAINVPAWAQAPAKPAAQPTYVLRGFRLSGAPGVDADALVAQLKDKPGDRITEADMTADTEALRAMLKAKHIAGQLFTTMAEKDGRVWVLFDFQPAAAAGSDLSQNAEHVEAQIFEGNVALSTDALTKASGLKPGDMLPDGRVATAGHAIKAAYAQALPGAKVKIKCKIRTQLGGKVTLDWIIVEPGH